MAIKVAINGFGRIGRCVARIIASRDDVELVAINDTAAPDMLEYITKYDTVHGTFDGVVKIENGYLHMGKVKAKLYSTRDANELTFSKECGAEVILECTGAYLTQEKCQVHIDNGAKKVVMSAPAKDNTPTFVLGVNEHEYKGQKIISNASCTTNGLGPVAKIIDDAFGIETALMTEIHAVTADQSVLDHAHRDLRRARASGHNIIPTTSSALGALKQVMPKMEGRIDGYSIRVPTINVAAIDLTFISQSPITVHKINEVLTQAAHLDYAQIMQVTSEDLVSSDFNHSPYSLIVDLTQTMVVGHQAKVFAWYDNEWGYANRLLDLCESFH